MKTDQDSSLPQKNVQAWDSHYKKQKSRQIWPDENLVRILKPLTPGSALDLGCGSGRHLRLLLDLGYSPVFGLDTSAQAIQLCKKAEPKAQCQKLDTISGNKVDIFKFNPDIMLDLIVAWGVLHYNSPDLQLNMIQQLYDHLKPGGTFTGTFRSDKDTHYRENSDINSAPIYLFNEAQVKEILSKNFENIKLGYLERGPIGNHHKKVCHWIFVCTKNEKNSSWK